MEYIKVTTKGYEKMPINYELLPLRHAKPQELIAVFIPKNLLEDPKILSNNKDFKDVNKQYFWNWLGKEKIFKSYVVTTFKDGLLNKLKIPKEKHYGVFKVLAIEKHDVLLIRPQSDNLVKLKKKIGMQLDTLLNYADKAIVQKTLDEILSYNNLSTFSEQLSQFSLANPKVVLNSDAFNSKAKDFLLKKIIKFNKEEGNILRATSQLSDYKYLVDKVSPKSKNHKAIRKLALLVNSPIVKNQIHNINFDAERRERVRSYYDGDKSVTGNGEFIRTIIRQNDSVLLNKEWGGFPYMVYDYRFDKEKKKYYKDIEAEIDLNKIIDKLFNLCGFTENQLAEIVSEAPVKEMKKIAIPRITNNDILKHLINKIENNDLITELVNQLTDKAIIEDIAFNGKIYYAKLKAIEKIDDENLLAKFVLKEDSYAVLMRIKDRSLLQKIASEHSKSHIRERAKKLAER